MPKQPAMQNGRSFGMHVTPAAFDLAVARWVGALASLYVP